MSSKTAEILIDGRQKGNHLYFLFGNNKNILLINNYYTTRSPLVVGLPIQAMEAWCLMTQCHVTSICHP